MTAFPFRTRPRAAPPPPVAGPDVLGYVVVITSECTTSGCRGTHPRPHPTSASFYETPGEAGDEVRRWGGQRGCRQYRVCEVRALT